ncbi:MAG TPA: DUF3147 family protein [Gammaproteobacteria bacterium]
MSPTLWFVVKVVISALLIAAISELGKRSSLLAALLASLPLISVLAMFWLFVETRDAQRVAALASDIFWLVLPSLALFIALPLLLRRGVDFYLAMALSIALTITCYGVMMRLLKGWSGVP